MKKKKKINIIYIFPAHKSASGGGKVVYKHCELINKFKIDNVSSRILHLKKTKISKILLSLKKRMFNKPSKNSRLIVDFVDHFRHSHAWHAKYIKPKKRL